jgi:hypothetical protein
MAAWTLTTIAIGAAAALVAGCAVDTAPPVDYTASAGGGSGSSGGGSTAGTSGTPMLVDVDPNLTLTAQGGEGVGVFTEYTTGGHWHVWWTCDTNQSGFGCQFAVAISVASGAIANVAGQGLGAGDAISQPGPGEVVLTTATSTTIDGVHFDAPPGAIITVDAKMNGVDDGSLLFFVQDSLVNGGYRGPLTDPLMFEPSSP